MGSPNLAADPPHETPSLCLQRVRFAFNDEAPPLSLSPLLHYLLRRSRREPRLSPSALVSKKHLDLRAERRRRTPAYREHRQPFPLTIADGHRQHFERAPSPARGFDFRAHFPLDGGPRAPVPASEPLPSSTNLVFFTSLPLSESSAIRSVIKETYSGWGHGQALICPTPPACIRHNHSTHIKQAAEHRRIRPPDTGTG